MLLSVEAKARGRQRDYKGRELPLGDMTTDGRGRAEERRRAQSKGYLLMDVAGSD